MSDWLDAWFVQNDSELISFRRDLHAHPELGYAEHRTTARIADRLVEAGLKPTLLAGTGLFVDIGQGEPIIGLRADIDALPLAELTDLEFASTVEGVSHACGHDIHTTIALGAALALATQAERLNGRVRVIFQPAEEVLGGAHRVFDGGGMDGVERSFALHCDPRVALGLVGTRVGPITAACDQIEVRVSGPGGHTARPHLTVDVVDTLSRIVINVPGLASRLVDPRTALSVVFGSVQAGVAANTIPSTGTARGTVRMLDRDTWDQAEDLICRLVREVAEPTGATVEIDYVRGVPPVVNDATSVALLEQGVRDEVGHGAIVSTQQSLGGEDFGWYADHGGVAMARLGVHSGDGPLRDLHQGTFQADERAIAIGIQVFVGTALAALHPDRRRTL